MRIGLALACFTLATAITAGAGAQPKKKKRPKKPRTEQRADPRPPKDDPPEDDGPRSDPPRIETKLREEEPAAPAANPWAASGEVRKKGEPVAGDDKGPSRRRPEEARWTSRPIALTAQGGYAAENLRIGFGLRVGYSIFDQFYVGASFVYHLGTRFGDTTFGGYYPAGEIGYDYHVQGVTIRPYTGVGMFVTTVSGSSNVVLKGGNALAVYPGAQIDYQLGPGFIGIDGRVLFILQTGTSASIGLFAVGGVRF